MIVCRVQLSLRPRDYKRAGNFDDTFPKSGVAAKMLPKERSRCFPTSPVIIALSRDAITLFMDVLLKLQLSGTIHSLQKIRIVRLGKLHI